MVLCAGLGTRLRPLTDELPKPLVPIGDRTILAHIAAALRAAGLDAAVINTHHLADKFPPVIGNLGIKIEVVNEAIVRGTAGGVAGARALLGPAPVVVWNGDILVDDPPLAALLDFAGDGLCLAVAPRPAGEGTVGLDAAGGVVRLRGERFGDEARGGDYVGIAAIGARCLATLPEMGCLVGDWALPELRAGRPSVASVDVTGAWTDAGDPASYLAANLAWLAGQAAGAARKGRGAVVAAGVELRQSIVGDGARVDGHGALERCVVWPGAHATAPLSDAIVTTSGRVVRVA